MAASSSQATAVIVLAAGSGARFGGPKLIAPLSGRPLLQHAIDAACELVAQDAEGIDRGGLELRGLREVPAERRASARGSGA